MRFHDSGWLVLLFLIPAFLWWGRRRRTEGRIRFATLSQLKRVSGLPRVDPRLVLHAVRAVALVLLVLAVARPQAGKKFTEVASEGVDIFLALDMSGSMQALDLKLDGKPAPRADVVKRVAGEFITKRANDRLGLIAFGESAFVQCPLTLDHKLLLTLLDAVHVGIAGDSTAIGDAVGVAVNHMKKLKAKSRTLILLTDGQSNAGLIPPLKAAEVAKEFGVRIYTIGIGVEGEAPFLVDTPFGKRVMYQRADLDEETLKKIADATGGKFYRAKETNELEKIYAEIDRLEKSEVKVKEYAEYTELFFLFLLPGIVFLLLEAALGGTILRRVP